MVQTNFREIDMDGIDAESYARSLADFGATVVTLNAGGILASYESKLPYHGLSAFGEHRRKAGCGSKSKECSHHLCP